MTKEPYSINLPLAGVESEHCVLIVDKGLSKIPRIAYQKVELNNMILIQQKNIQL